MRLKAKKNKESKAEPLRLLLALLVERSKTQVMLRCQPLSVHKGVFVDGHKIIGTKGRVDVHGGGDNNAFSRKG